MRRRGRLAVALALFGLGLLAPSAGAHANLVGSDPSNGTTLAKPPSEIRLQFNEEVSKAQARLLDGRGRVVPGTELSADGGTSLVLHLPRLPRDAYQVVWDALSAGDGHVTNGDVAFGVRTDVDAGGSASSAGSAGSPLELVLRWLDFVLMAGMLGGIAVAGVATSSAASERVGQRANHFAGRRMLGLAGVCAGGALVLGLLLYAWEAHDLRSALPAGESLSGAASALLSERWGELWIGREALLVALVVAVVLARRGRLSLRRRSTLGAIAGLAVCVAVARAAAGHAAGASDAWLAISADALHQLGAGIWIGGLFGFAAAVLATASAVGAAPAALVRGWWRSFAGVVGISAAAVVTTGLYSAGVEVASVDGLLTTFYGGTLVAKTALVGLVCLLGGFNALLIRRTRDGDSALPLKLFPLEMVLGAMVLVGAAALTSSSPPRGPEFASPRAAPVPTLSRAMGDLVTLTSVRPNRPGPNIFTVMAASSRRPPPAPVGTVSLLIRRVGTPEEEARTVRLSQFAPNRFSGGTELKGQGDWRMEEVVQRGGQRFTTPFSWVVAPPDPARPVSVSAKPLAPIIYRTAAIAVLVAVGAAICILALLWLRPPPRPARAGPAVVGPNRRAIR